MNLLDSFIQRWGKVTNKPKRNVLKYVGVHQSTGTQQCDYRQPREHTNNETSSEKTGMKGTHAPKPGQYFYSVLPTTGHQYRLWWNHCVLEQKHIFTIICKSKSGQHSAFTTVTRCPVVKESFPGSLVAQPSCEQHELVFTSMHRSSMYRKFLNQAGSTDAFCQNKCSRTPFGHMKNEAGFKIKVVIPEMRTSV